MRKGIIIIWNPLNEKARTPTHKELEQRWWKLSRPTVQVPSACPGGILQSICKNARACVVFVCSVNKVAVSGIVTGIHTDSRSSNEMQCCKNLCTIMNKRHLRVATHQSSRPVFLNLCETAARYILFSKDEGPVPTNLLVNTFPIFLSSYIKLT